MYAKQLGVDSAFVLHMRRIHDDDSTANGKKILDEYFVPHLEQLTSRWQMHLRAAPPHIRTQLERIDADYIRQLDAIMRVHDDCLQTWSVEAFSSR